MTRKRSYPAILSLFLLSAPGCTENTDAGICEFEDLGEVGPDVVGETGISPNDLIDLVEGRLTARFEPHHKDVDPTSSFDSSLELDVIDYDTAFEQRHSGVSTTGSERCPVGPLLWLPVTMRLVLDIGGSAEARAELVATGGGPAQQRIYVEAAALQDTPEWLDQVAQAVVGTGTASTPFIRLANALQPSGATFDAASGALFLGNASEQELYRFDGATYLE